MLNAVFLAALRVAAVNQARFAAEPAYTPIQMHLPTRMTLEEVQLNSGLRSSVAEIDRLFKLEPPTWGLTLENEGEQWATARSALSAFRSVKSDEDYLLRLERLITPIAPQMSFQALQGHPEGFDYSPSTVGQDTRTVVPPAAPTGAMHQNRPMRSRDSSRIDDQPVVNRRYKVFLSSTYVDLIPHRQAVTQALVKTDRCIPAGMEIFSASGQPPWNVITGALAGTDYLVLVLGNRYGSPVPGEGISYTEKEYEYALEHEIPVLTFLSDNTHSLAPDQQEKAKLQKQWGQIPQKGRRRRDDVTQAHIHRA